MGTTSDKLHLGCGLVTPEGWLNVDGSWNARLARYPLVHRLARAVSGKGKWEKVGNVYGHNVRKPLPWPDGTFGAVYASHLLEHLYRDDALRLLRECLRVLRPGGVVRMVVPDLAALVQGYLSGDFPKWLTLYDPFPERADMFVRGLLMRNAGPPQGSLVSRVYEALFDFHSHKWMYDASSLAAMLREAGFADVRAMPCRVSAIPGIDEVEQPHRVEDGGGVAAEGVKPGAAPEA